jgi:phosphopantothenoylcysteine decarboxylase/phosphopantothenate--cysteine ligase
MSATRVLITAGPTHEPIDAVRYLANRSSGRMGLAIAQACTNQGWQTTFLLGPVALAPPANITTHRYESTADLEALLVEHFEACDLLIMAAAVADYRPKTASAGKLERGDDKLILELEPTPDLVAGCANRRRPGQRILAFALEDPAQLAARAAAKLARKGVDAIVANPLKTMEAETITAKVLTADGTVHAPPPATPKAAFADWLIAWAAQQWQL